MQMRLKIICYRGGIWMKLPFPTVALLIVLVCIRWKQSIALIALYPVNITPLEQLTSDQISLTLRFDPLEVAVEDVNDSEVCMLINGDICHCFGSAFKDTQLSLVSACRHAITESCTNKEYCQYWFGLQLFPPSIESSPKRSIATSAIHVMSHQDLRSRITLLLPLTLDDLSRATVLLHSLSHIPLNTVYEMLVFVPDSQKRLVEGAILGAVQSLDLTFPVAVHAESVLFAGGTSAVKNVFPYAIQMSVKLLAARLVRTPYYITLDADVVLLRPFALDQVITSENRAIYHFEERTVHANWWTGSEQLLNITPVSSHKYHTWLQREHCSSAEDSCASQFGTLQAVEQGLGVTPVIMSTYGSLLTLSYMCRYLSPKHSPYAQDDTTTNSATAQRTECERRWLEGFGRQYSTIDANGVQAVSPVVMLWSEYTLYRVVLDHLEVFDEIHMQEKEAGETVLHCHNVWFAGQLPWQAKQAKYAENCLFSVIQSTSGVNPSTVYKQYIEHF